MKAIINNFEIDLSKPIDISIPMTNDTNNPLAWNQDVPKIEPVKKGDWEGRVSRGASVNFNNLLFNPHAHGTHTECLGHITREFYSINQCLKKFFFFASLISVRPISFQDDFIISRNQIEKELHAIGFNDFKSNSLIIRTLPNLELKKTTNYSDTNPAYLPEEAARFMNDIGIEHLLIDLPSVDKENDNGKLVAHRAFWNVRNTNHLNSDARLQCTITEMIYVPNEVIDGNYILNLQIASFENDASPSKPLLYKIK